MILAFLYCIFGSATTQIYENVSNKNIGETLSEIIAHIVNFRQYYSFPKWEK